MGMKIAIVSNTSWYIFNFRRNLIKALIAAGHEVVAIAPRDNYSHGLVAAGATFRHFDLSRDGTEPLAELKSIFSLRKIIKEEKINAVLSYTPKGNIYSGLSIKGSSIALIANVSGLGRLFTEKSWLTSVVRLLYVFSFRSARLIYFQNEDDRRLFIDSKLVPKRTTERLPGSGVDLVYFSPQDNRLAERESGTVFLLVARLLWDKGIGEFVRAAKVIRSTYKNVRFQILGPFDTSNPSAIPRSSMDEWTRDGTIEYFGAVDDVRPYINQASCVVLPSYREGVPRSLLEAAAMAKPVITTDTPGCRDVVDDAVTGFLCRPKDVADLVDKMERFLALGTAERAVIGCMGRKKMEHQFSETLVIDRYLNAIEILEKKGNK